MINLNIKYRISFLEIKSYLYKFKTKIDFENEFDFNSGQILGKGAFGIVKKCKSKFDEKDYAIK